MKWFKHDSSANRDDKLGKVLLKYGSDGYALYWLCLELIADRLDGENASFELKHDAELLGAILKIDTLRVEEIMKYFIMLKLFETDSGAVTCYKLGLRLDRSTARNPDILSIIDRISTDKYGQVRTSTARLDKIRIDKNNTPTETSEKSEELALLLFDLHSKIDPGFQASTSRLHSWALDIDKLNRIDGREWQQIEDVIRWAKADDFWKPNIISGKKLREKFTLLVARMPKRLYNKSEEPTEAPADFKAMLERSAK